MWDVSMTVFSVWPLLIKSKRKHLQKTNNKIKFSTQKSVDFVLKNKLKFEGGGLQNRRKKKGIKLIASMQRSGFCA